MKHSDIDFTHDHLQCSINGKTVWIPLNENTLENNNIIINTANDAINKENDAVRSNTDDTRIANKENTIESFSWCDASTKLFLATYKDAQELLTNRKLKTKKMLWNKVTIQMQQNGYNVTPIQVENKYKSLERSYKNMISNNKKTGRSRMSCPYET